MADDRDDPGATPPSGPGASSGAHPPLITSVPGFGPKVSPEQAEPELGHQPRADGPPQNLDYVDEDDASDTIPRIRPTVSQPSIAEEPPEPPTVVRTLPAKDEQPPQDALPAGAVVPAAAVPPPTAVPPGTGGAPPIDGSRRRRGGLIAAAVVLVVAIGGIVGWRMQESPASSQASARSTPPATGLGGVAANSSARAARSTTSASASASAPASTARRSSAAPPAAGSTSGYAVYTDPRFGFTMLYPADFGAGPTNLKDSGREWLGDSDGAVTVRAFGQNNPGVTIEQEQATRLHGMVERYARIRGDVLTLSAYVDGGKGIVYIREVVGRGSMNILEWTYPTDQKATWDAAVTLSAHTFVPGDLSVSH